MPVNVRVAGNNVVAQLVDDESCYVASSENGNVIIHIGEGSLLNKSLKKGKVYKCYLKGSKVRVKKVYKPSDFAL